MFGAVVFLGSIIGGSVVLAQDEAKYDLAVENMRFVECDADVINRAMDMYVTRFPITNYADDKSYFDIDLSKGEGEPTGSIDRTICYEYELRNNSSEVFEVDWVVGEKGVLEVNSIIDAQWQNSSWTGKSSAIPSLMPGEAETIEMSQRTRLNDSASRGANCVGVEYKLVDIFQWEDYVSFYEGPNAEVLASDRICYGVNQYDFPTEVGGFGFEEVNGKRIKLSWDGVEGADSYEIEFDNLAPNTLDTFYELGIEGESVEVEMPKDDLYLLQIWAVKDGVRGTGSKGIYFSAGMPLFSDVLVNSWYFPYLHELQASAIVSGYKDSEGNLTGKFGPGDKLTVAEAMKIAVEANFWGNRPLGEVSLPERLRGHWGAEYFERGIDEGVSLVSDLEGFNPDRPITRGELVNLITELELNEIPEYESYSAPDLEGYEYADGVEYGFERGWISGYPDGSFRPEGLLNRAEIVKIASKAY